MVKPLDPKEQAQDAAAVKEATDLLKKTYRRQFRRDVAGLQEEIDLIVDQTADIPGWLVLRAVKNHILDETENRDGGTAGDFFPSIARIRKLCSKADEQERLQAAKDAEKLKETLSHEQRVSLGDRKQIFKIEDPNLQQIFGKDWVECVPDTAFKCATCADKGWVRFYYLPTKRHVVYESEEYFKLCDEYPDFARQLRVSECICVDCDLGLMTENRYIENEERHTPPTHFHIRRKAMKRREAAEKAKREAAERAQQTLLKEVA